MATRLGDHRFDDKLDDLSPEARAANVERDRRALAELPRKVDYNTLSRGGQIDYEILRQHLTRAVWLAETFRPFEDDPRTYGDYLTESVYLLLTQSSLPRRRTCTTPWPAWPRSPGWSRPPGGRSAGRPGSRSRRRSARPRGRSTSTRVTSITLAGAPPGAGELAARAGEAIRALEGYLGFLEAEVLPRSTESWRIGPEKFARKLDLELDAGLTAAEVLREAEAEASRVEREMAVIARQMWGTTFPGEPIPPDDAEGRRRP